MKTWFVDHGLKLLTLFGVLAMFAVTSVAGKAVGEAIGEHAKTIGHPIVVERLNRHELEMQQIEGQVKHNKEIADILREASKEDRRLIKTGLQDTNNLLREVIRRLP